MVVYVKILMYIEIRVNIYYLTEFSGGDYY